jgi:DNA-binding Xre family transcriptional regulator
VNTLISYRPLRIYCLDHKIKLTNLVRECGLSNSVVTKINNDINMEIKAIDKICLFLKIPIEQAIEIIN